jgi:hypothetical protein
MCIKRKRDVLGTDMRWHTVRWSQTLRDSGIELRCMAKQMVGNCNFSLCVSHPATGRGYL